MQIGRVQRVRLGEFPTPLQELKNLRKHLNGPQIFIKRDDLNGLGLGGNKLRKLEYAMAEATEQGATAVITVGAVQSNHARLTTAAANRLGLKTYLVLRGEEPKNATGNFLIDKLLAAEEIHCLQGSAYSDKDELASLVKETVERLEKDLREKGETPYYIPNGCRSLHGALGYSSCILEIVTRLREEQLSPDCIVTACGTSSTLTGLALGSVLYAQEEMKVLGMSISASKEALDKKIERGLAEAVKFLDLKQAIDKDLITIYDEYIGEAYGAATDEMREAVRLVARTEGIILDPVYTGKAMAGLIDLIRKGHFRRDDVVVFLHTGGVPGLFAEQQSATF
ncbi:D-cysteine desulfhydrase family protein [Candidatus Bipolaricaulota bacterium]|nr:D-cysteine desulfhydrase family protein [Candidatus Bipolaricaulota bacterium]